jgi:type VI secretion system protein ImpF
MANTYSPSLLDKLLGDAHEGQRGVLARFNIERMKDSVARDIEHVLNTHASFSPEDLAAYPRAAKSLVTLGLVDITSLSMASDRDRQRIGDNIRDALTRQDARLRDVDVSVREDRSAQARLSFSIRAKLLLHPDSEPVAFDAVLHPGSQRYEVAQSDNRADSRAARQGS